MAKKIIKKKKEKYVFSPKPAIVSATRLRNYFLKDTILDYFKAYPNKVCNELKVNIPIQQNNEYDLNTYLMKRGVEFEKSLVDFLKEHFELETIDFGKDFNQKQIDTFDAMKRGVEIIHQGLLVNTDGTFGYCDLLIRSDYFNELIEYNHFTEDELKIPAPNLGTDFHYIVIEVKSRTLELCCDGLRIRNNSPYPAYKAQTLVYNRALGDIQGYKPKIAFIMGTGFKFTSKDIIFHETNPYKRLGEVREDDWDLDIGKNIGKAVEWHKKLNEQGNTWNLLPLPSVPELYPNMCNHQNYEWETIKKKYAEQISEITLLWYVGVNHREKAHNNNIFSFKDKKCTIKALGFNNINSDIVEEMININRNDDIILKINHNNFYLKNGRKMYVDFETLDNPFSDKNYIFLIGLYVKKSDNTTEFNSYVMKELNDREQMNVLYEFYLQLKKTKNNKLMHWSAFEVITLNKILDRLNEEYEKHKLYGKCIRYLFDCTFDWIDLMKVLQKDKFVVNGCFGYSLGSVCDALKKHNLLTTYWDTDLCLNGENATIIAKKYYDKECSQEVFNQIIDYNKVDCVVMDEIIDIIKNHLQN